MKKYAILFSITFAILLFSLFLNEKINADVPVLDTFTAKSQTVKDTVIASGILVDKNSTKYEYSIPIKLNNVFVSEGDYVNTGDVLFSVDREGTVNYLMQSGLSTLMSGNFDYNLITAIPENIRATSNGYVTAVNYTSGELYDTLNPVVTLSSKENLVAKVTVSENFISKIKKGMTATVVCPGISSDKIKGKVSEIGNIAKAKYTETGANESTVDVEISFDEPVNPKLGFSLTATINVDEREAVLLPYNSIMQDDKGEYVYVFKGNHLIERLYIKTKNDYKKGSEVSDELGGTILVKNPEKLKGSKVRILTE